MNCVSVLLNHSRGLRNAADGDGITYSAVACANVSADLERIANALQELLSAADDVSRVQLNRRSNDLGKAKQRRLRGAVKSAGGAA